MMRGMSTKVVLAGSLRWILRAAGKVDDFTVRPVKLAETCRPGARQVFPWLALQDDLKGFGSPAASSIGPLIKLQADELVVKPRISSHTITNQLVDLLPLEPLHLIALQSVPGSGWTLLFLLVSHSAELILAYGHLRLGCDCPGGLFVWLLRQHPFEMVAFIHTFLLL